MVPETRFGIYWKSRKGSKCEQNQDGAAVLELRTAMFAIVVDGFEASGRANNFGTCFAREVVDAIALREEIELASVIQVMRNVHSVIRLSHTPQKFCFAALLLRRDLDLAWTMNSGDCRVGMHIGIDDCEWVTPVHCLANAMDKNFDARHIDHPFRHVVTRAVGLRFGAPEVLKFEDIAEISWTLATDGYWVSTLALSGSPLPKEDDTSVLRLQIGIGVVCDSDCQNLYVRQVR